MGLFDRLLRPKEASKKESIPHSSTVLKRESTNRSASSREVRTVSHKKEALKVTDTTALARKLQLTQILPETKMVFYCPVRNAKVFCHSILVDKLGDLTKFILTSMYEGHTIEEICSLTQMGHTTLKEELAYLIRGGLIEDDETVLTELGKQYGKLLELFATLSDGIDVAFNVFADAFEPIERDNYVFEPDQKFVLTGHFIPALARNDNYANSLKIAQEQIVSEAPFSREIKNSLYTTVRIEKETAFYKPVCLSSFDRGLISEEGSCVKVAIPFDRITYKPHYRWLDPYRDAIPIIEGLEEKYHELLSDKAKLLISAAQEENDASVLTRDVNTITGAIDYVRDDLIETPDDQSMFVVERNQVQLHLDEDSCEGLYLQEIKREQLYRILFYPYRRMEA